MSIDSAMHQTCQVIRCIFEAHLPYDGDPTDMAFVCIAEQLAHQQQICQCLTTFSVSLTAVKMQMLIPLSWGRRVPEIPFKTAYNMAGALLSPRHETWH